MFPFVCFCVVDVVVVVVVDDVVVLFLLTLQIRVLPVIMNMASNEKPVVWEDNFADLDLFKGGLAADGKHSVAE